MIKTLSALSLARRKFQPETTTKDPILSKAYTLLDIAHKHCYIHKADEKIHLHFI